MVDKKKGHYYLSAHMYYNNVYHKPFDIAHSSNIIRGGFSVKTLSVL